MKIRPIPTVPVLPDDQFVEFSSVPGEGEKHNIDGALRGPVDFRQVQIQFQARGEATWQEYQRSGIAHSVDLVFARIQARIEGKRRDLLSRRP